MVACNLDLKPAYKVTPAKNAAILTKLIPDTVVRYNLAWA